MRESNNATHGERERMSSKEGMDSIPHDNQRGEEGTQNPFIVCISLVGSDIFPENKISPTANGQLNSSERSGAEQVSEEWKLEDGTKGELVGRIDTVRLLAILNFSLSEITHTKH